MKTKNYIQTRHVKLPNRPATAEFPIVRIGVIKSIAGMWPNAK